MEEGGGDEDGRGGGGGREKGGGQSDAARAAVEPRRPGLVGGGGLQGGGGSGESGGGAQRMRKVLIRTWRCGECHYWNLPSRTSCRTCSHRRTSDALRRDDWWQPGVLPPGAEVDAGVPFAGRVSRARDLGGSSSSMSRWSGGGGGGGGGASARREFDHCPTVRRIPGLAPGGKSAKVEQRSGGGKGGGGGAVDPADPRLHAPGVLDRACWGPRPVAVDGNSGPAAAQQGNGKGSRDREESRGKGPQLEADGRSGDAGGDGHEEARAPLPSELPPLRGWQVPKVPRAAIQRQVAAAAERLDHLKAAGAKPRKVERAAKVKAEAEQKLRVAGGPSSRSLLWQIKAEEDKIMQADKAIEAANSEREQKLAEIAKLTEDVALSESLEQRHVERRAEATERLQYLTNQKWENVPEAWVEQFKELERTLGATAHRAHPMVQAQ